MEVVKWDELVEFIYTHSELNLNKEEIEEVLELEEDYLYQKGLLGYIIDEYK